MDSSPDPRGPLAAAGHRPADAEETVLANRGWWDGANDWYVDTHGDFLGPHRFVWCPEGLDEDDAGLLGDVAGRDVLEVGCGAAQCSRRLAERGASAVALDLSAGMLAHARAMGRGHVPADPHGRVALVQADARRLPFASGSFDLAFSAYGALPFVADPWLVTAEVARVLRPGGRWVFALSHPIRWAFPDDPGEAGLTVTRSYFDATPYVEEDAAGRVLYAEHHRTLEQRVADVVDAGLVLHRLVEPSWPDGHERVWGGWSPLRGRLFPGTAIFVTAKPL